MPRSGRGLAAAGVGGAAAAIFPHLLPGSPFADEGELAADIGARSDKNGDDQVCVKTLWGDHLNPKSHWSIVGYDTLGEPTILYLVRDDNAGAEDAE
jgi:hypothetical protein